MPSNISRARRTCANKTRRGNVYAEEWLAARCARNIAGTVAFQCPACGLWHIGKPLGTRNERAALRPGSEGEE